MKDFSAKNIEEVNEIIDQMGTDWYIGEAEGVHCYIEDDMYNVEFIHSGIMHQFHPENGKIIKLSPYHPPSLEEEDFEGEGEKVGWNGYV